MKQCPRCGRYLNFKLAYNYGSPYVGYDCVCGYDSFKDIRTTVTTSCSTTGEIKNEKYSTKII